MTGKDLIKLARSTENKVIELQKQGDAYNYICESKTTRRYAIRN